MTKYEIEIGSKRKESFYPFFKLTLEPSVKLKKTQETLSFLRKKTQIKKITVLKSPHVNKKAQEQFQFVIHKNRMKYFSWENKKNTMFLKKIKNSILPSLKIKIEKTLSSNENQVNKIKSLNPLINVEPNTTLSPLKQLKKKKMFIANPGMGNQEQLNKTLLCLKKLDNYGWFTNKLSNRHLLPPLPHDVDFWGIRKPRKINGQTFTAL